MPDPRDAAPAAQLDWPLRIGWGVGSLGATTLINGITFLGLFYFTGILGIAPALAGSLLFAAKLFDIVTDPLMGLVSDRTNTRWGRRRPYLLVAAIISGLSFLMLFNTPRLDGAALTVYVLAGLLLYATGYTMFNIPYLAMPAEMTGDYHERSRLMSVRVVFAALGILAGGALAPALVTGFGEGREGYAAMSWVLALLISGGMIAAFFGTSRASHTRHQPTALSLHEQGRLILGNRPYLVLMSAKLLHMLGVSLSTSSLLFLITQVLERDTAAAGLLGLASTAGTLASVPAWLAACRRIGKRNTYLVAAAIFVPVALSWLVAGPAEATAWLLLRGLGIGIATGGLTLTAQAMLPDTIDHDARRSGLRREGVFTAGYSFMEKSAFALGPLLFGWLLATGGYDSGATGTVGLEARRAILLAAAVLPALASTLSAALLLAYRLDAQYLRAGAGRE